MDTDMLLLYWWFKNPNETFEQYFNNVIRTLEILRVGVFLYEEVDLENSYGFGGEVHYQLLRARDVKAKIPDLVEELWETKGTRATIRETLNRLATTADNIRTDLRYETTMLSYYRFVDGKLDKPISRDEFETDWEEFSRDAREQLKLQKWVLNELYIALKTASENIVDPKDLIWDSPYMYIGERRDLIEVVFALLYTGGVTNADGRTLSQEQFYRDFMKFFKVEPGKAHYATELKSLVNSRKGEKISKVLSPAIEALRAEKAK